MVICGFHLRDMTAELLAADPRRNRPGAGGLLSRGTWRCAGMKTSSSWRSPPTRAEFFASLDLARGALTGAAPAAHPQARRSAGEEHLIHRAQGGADGDKPDERGGGPPLYAEVQHGRRDAAGDTARLILERYTG